MISHFLPPSQHNLILFMASLYPKSWPTRCHPSPSPVLMCLMFSTSLSLEIPLPTTTGKHHLNILSIPLTQCRILESPRKTSKFMLPTSRSYTHTCGERPAMVGGRSDINSSRSWCSRWNEGMQETTWATRYTTPWRRMALNKSSVYGQTTDFFFTFTAFFICCQFCSVVDLYFSRLQSYAIPPFLVCNWWLRLMQRKTYGYQLHITSGPRYTLNLD